MERCPHRDQRVILWYSHRVLSLLLSFPRSGFSLSISCMGHERSSGCCVILRSRSIGATSNFVPPPLFYAGRRRPPTSLISHSLHTPVSGSHLLSAFSYHHYIVAVCLASLSSSLALALIVCAYYFLPLTPFVVYISYPTFLLCLYSPSLTVVLS